MTGEGFYFILINSYAFVIVFAMFFLRNLYSKSHFLFLVVAMLFLFATGKIFIGSKTIIIIITLILWFSLTNRKAFWIIFLSLAGFYLFIGPIVSLITGQFSSDLVVSYKFTQIFSVFEVIDLDIIASSSTSMGNIIAEGATIIQYLSNNTTVLFFGKGFGGGLPDIFGYLGPMAGPGAG